MSGKVSNFSNYPNGFNGGLVLDGLSTHKTHAGKVFHVANGSAGTRADVPNAKGASDGNKGTFLDPFKTLGYAVEQCAEGRGDVIVCHPGMIDDVETSIDIESGNITILGLGAGNDRPQLTPGVLNALDVEGDNVTIQNMYFNEADSEIVTSVDVVGAGFRFLDNQMDLGAHDDNPITVTATGEEPTFAGNRFVVTANGTVGVIDIEGVIDNPQFINNTNITSVANYDQGFVDMEAIAVTNAYFEGNKLIGGGTELVATADVGTVVGGTGVQRPIEVTTIASEVTAANDETFKPAINGNVDIHGVWFRYSSPDDTGNEVTISTETGVTIIAATETETASVAGDVFYAVAQGSAGVVDEAGVAETVFMSNPIRVTGAAAAENLIDVVFAGGTEGHGTLYVAWSPADDATTSEIAAS